MSFYRVALLGLLAGTSLLTSFPVAAHAQLLAVTPADHSAGPAPAHIELSFSERLLTPLSGAELVLTAMPGMAMQAVKVAAKITFAGDAKSMLLIPAKPLIPGNYRLDWHVISADTHPRQGSVTFQVK